MSHFAKIDKYGYVLDVIVAEQDFINSGALGDSFEFVQTSYNSNFRKNYAGVGYMYDKQRDAFIPIQEFDSWVLNEDTCQWEAPTPTPESGSYTWDEETTNWKEMV
jgi:hypothetical protein